MDPQRLIHFRKANKNRQNSSRINNLKKELHNYTGSRDVIFISTEVESLIREYYEQFHASKLRKMDWNNL